VSEEYAVSIFRISNLVLMGAEVMGREQMCPLYRKVARTVDNADYGKGRGTHPFTKPMGSESLK
jgi:hypothetical protein